ncbi:MAG: hypothetical protein RL885_13795, partial [Planctomycetota bacterium]
ASLDPPSHAAIDASVDTARHAPLDPAIDTPRHAEVGAPLDASSDPTLFEPVDPHARDSGTPNLLARTSHDPDALLVLALSRDPHAAAIQPADHHPLHPIDSSILSLELRNAQPDSESTQSVVRRCSSESLDSVSHDHPDLPHSFAHHDSVSLGDRDADAPQHPNAARRCPSDPLPRQQHRIRPREQRRCHDPASSDSEWTRRSTNLRTERRSRPLESGVGLRARRVEPGLWPNG